MLGSWVNSSWWESYETVPDSPTPLLGLATMSQSHDMMTAMNMPPLVFLLNG